jgi:hypothetical protein
MATGWPSACARSKLSSAASAVHQRGAHPPQHRLWKIGLLKDAQASQDAFRELERKDYIPSDTLRL